MSNRKTSRLPPEVNRALYVRNLPFQITRDEMYDIFGKFGAIRQIRLGNAPDTRGTAFVVYEDIFSAKDAVENLSGFNVCGRYLIVLYYQQVKMLSPMGTPITMLVNRSFNQQYINIKTQPPPRYKSNSVYITIHKMLE